MVQLSSTLINFLFIFGDSIGVWILCVYCVVLPCVTGFSTLHTNLCSEIYFVNMSKNWTEAQSYCRENYTDLVTIDNPEEMNRVINSVNLTGYTGPAWIGLEKGNSWNWQWSLEERRLYSDGQTGFSNWNSGQCDNYEGKEHCVQMYPSGKWNDICCDETFSVTRETPHSATGHQENLLIMMGMRSVL
uniref:C-type lectin domain-containing protein n=1 Tax=Scleropages formosus TaxID=113540 RepID=A0A8C9SE85_SCLFO